MSALTVRRESITRIASHPAPALTAARIPYRIVAGTRFFDRAEVKDCLAYLTLAVNPNDTSTHLAGFSPATPPEGGAPR